MSEKHRAYSALSIKSVSDEKRIIRGIATTPAPDRHGDIVEPLGVTFKNPLPLLWQHRHDMPVGTVKFDKPTKDGITFTAELPNIGEDGELKALIDKAWQSITLNLVRAVSIGFRPLELTFMDDGGVRFVESEVFELSLVTIPANSGAVITSTKSLDSSSIAVLKKFDIGASAASGTMGTSVAMAEKAIPGASGKVKSISLKKQEPKMAKTIAEQIAALEQKRAANAARMEEIMTKSVEEGRSTEADEQEEFDTLQAELSIVDDDLKRFRALEKVKMQTAKPVFGQNQEEGTRSRDIRTAPAIIRSLKNEEKGVGFAKFALAMYAGKGEVNSAKAFVEANFSDDHRLQTIMKAAVAAGSTTSPTWAGNLVDYQTLAGEFIDYLRPRTIIGQFGTTGSSGMNVPPLRKVPFNVKIPGKTAAGSAQWVGEGFRKPVTSSSYAPVTMKWAKIAAICVITDELDRFSDPSVQMLVRDDLADAVIERMDVDFIDPNKGIGTGSSESPASITNGVTPIPSSGNDADAISVDIASLWSVADSTNLPAGSAVYITDQRTARKLSTIKNPMGAKEYPLVTPQGGSIDGVPLIVSNYVPADSSGSLFILAFASEIYLADDGSVNIDISKEATIFLDDAAATATPTAAQLVSMFQTNQLAVRAERYVRWQKRRPQAVAYLSGVNWGE